MISIRPLARADLQPAAQLLQRVMTGRNHGLPSEALGFLESTLFQSPWADRDLPCLGAVDGEGRLVGWVGVGPRRMRLGSRAIRLVVCSHLVVDPAVRDHAVGAQLLKDVFAGPQDATISDTPSEAVRRIWLVLGGESVAVGSIHWIRVFRPWAVGLQVLADRRAHGRRPKPAVGAARLLDRATMLAAGPRLRPVLESPTEEPLSPDTLLEHLEGVTRRRSLVPAYDRDYLEWLFTQMTRGERHGRIVARLVRGQQGAVAGWYVYSLRPERRSEVLELAARSERDAARVLAHLEHHACTHGAAALRGRLEPQLVAPIARDGRILRYGWGALIHSRDPEIRHAIQSGDALLTRMEGEWWWSDALT